MVDEPIVWSIKTLLREKKKRAKHEEQEAMQRAAADPGSLCAASQHSAPGQQYSRARVPSGTPNRREPRGLDDVSHSASSRNELFASFHGGDTSKSSQFAAAKELERMAGNMTPHMLPQKAQQREA